jgi:hypothetical protein
MDALGLLILVTETILTVSPPILLIDEASAIPSFPVTIPLYPDPTVSFTGKIMEK